MVATKLTVALPEDLASYIREQVAEGRFGSVSAFVTWATESMRDIDAPDAVVAQVWRRGAGRQARVATLLGMAPGKCATLPLDTLAAKRIGNDIVPVNPDLAEDLVDV